MKFSRFFLPHPETHQKAHLLSFKAFAVYFLLFFMIEFFVRGVPVLGYEGVGPERGVLGASYNITQTDIVALTNQERAKLGLQAVTEDSRLDAAAAAKAQNMFAENYWAHYSPSGKDPWGFIQGAGYQFSYAGENLARNFSASPEVVAAWMASPTHRDNIVNTHYTNIGVAIAEGKINGTDTILVVQEFGRPSQNMLAALPLRTQQVDTTQESASPLPLVESSSVPVIVHQLPTVEQSQVRVAGSETNNAIFKWGGISISRSFGLTIIGLLIILIGLDLYILRRRMVHRLASHHLPHLALLGVAASVLWNSGGGEITKAAVMVVAGN